MPLASKVIPKRLGRVVAVAFYFGDTVIVEFAPKGNAAYVYKADKFEKILSAKTNDISIWKDSSLTLKNPFTNSRGTKHHHRGWKDQFKLMINHYIRNQNV